MNIKSLEVARLHSNPVTSVLLTKQINKWKTLLVSYRSYNTDLTAMLTAEDLQYRNMIQMYDRFIENGISGEELVKGIDYAFVSGPDASYLNSHPSPALSEFKDEMSSLSPNTRKSNYLQTFSKVSDLCMSTIPGQRNEYVDNICSDFQPNKWKNLFDVIYGACGMPGSSYGQPSIQPSTFKPTARPQRHRQRNLEVEKPFVNASTDAVAPNRKLLDSPLHPLMTSSLVAQMCKQMAIDQDVKDSVPGGLISPMANQQMWDFLKSPKTKFLTFSAHAPMTLAWTSFVTDGKLRPFILESLLNCI